MEEVKVELKNKDEDPIIKINSRLFNPSIWDDLPMKRNNIEKGKIIEPDFEMDEISSKKTRLPKGCEFKLLNPKKREDITALTLFLNEHYLDDTSLISYTPEYISYRLKMPAIHYRTKNIQTILTVKSGKNIFGVVVANPIIYMIDDQIITSVQIEWLTTHKNLRTKRMTIQLLKELYKILHSRKIEFGSIFWCDSNLPFQSITKPSTLLVRDLHTQVAQKKIAELKNLRNDSVLPEEIKKINKVIEDSEKEDLNPNKDIHQIRLANKNDVLNLMEIYNTRCSDKFRIYRIYNQKEFEYKFLPRKNMIYTYVFTNSDGEVKDFITFHMLPSKTDKHSSVANLTYATYPSKKERILELFLENLLYVLRESSYDKIIAHSVLGIENVLIDKLKFKKLDNKKVLNIFNYNTKQIDIGECGLEVCI